MSFKERWDFMCFFHKQAREKADEIFAITAESRRKALELMTARQNAYKKLGAWTRG